MTVLVGVSALVQARYSRFTECLANLEHDWDFEDPHTVMFATGIDIGENRNAIVRRALAGRFDHVWFVDDDMVFQPDHLRRLLAHKQAVVASLYLTRKPPHYPLAFNQSDLIDGVPYWKPVSLMGAPETGLADIVAAGTAGMLIRRDVLERIEYDTWFDHHQSTDDLAFCGRVTDAGYQIYLDLAAVMGHISTYEVWPSFQQQQGWMGEVRISDDCSFDVKLGD